METSKKKNKNICYVEFFANKIYWNQITTAVLLWAVCWDLEISLSQRTGCTDANH